MTNRMPQGEELVIARLAAHLKRLGLVDVSLLALDGLRPLGLLAGQLLWVAQPTLGLLADGDDIGALAEVLERPEGVDALRRELEAARS